MQNYILIQSLKLYFKNTFNFTGRTKRNHYWWAMSFIYLFTLGIANLGIQFNQIYILAAWLLLNIIPLITLNIRRLRDIGLSNKYLLGIALVIITTAILVITVKSRLAATILQIVSLLVVVAPILKTDEIKPKKA